MGARRSAAGVGVGECGIAVASRHEELDLVDGLNGSASAYGGAVESCGGAGEVELAIEGPSLEEAVDESCVEDVSCTGGIDYRDAVCGGVVELLAIPGDDALRAEGCGGEATPVAAMDGLQGFFEVWLSHEAGREVAADDEVVDVFDEVFDAGVELVEVGDDGDSGFAGPSCCEGCGGGVVAIDVEGPGVDDPVAVEVGGLEDEALVAAA